ncbi:hypothetical protein [Emticicia sp. W12TSBA100-4]|uniref:hypothetical protein n=1 Tax=Emticicia sp. W12TSBA100-4 TaxID=3160965 RepID=UPI003305B9E9
MKKRFSILTLTYLLMACAPSNNQKQDTLTVEKVSSPMVGNDADEHGCKASAGYQWSVLRNECIRIFEAGVRLDPVAKDLEQSLSAFVVIKTDSSDQEIELFVPYDEQTIIVKKESDDKWKNDKYVLTKAKDTYSIEDATKKLLYKGTIEK